MARPFPDKFDREISPLSPQSGGSQTPISYSANVNRQKTKKWVEAKPADYGGDDWGDDYNDYSAHLPQLPKATGFRQPGQASQSPSSGRFPDDEITKKTYGDLPSLPTDSQARSVTNPVRNRANSFTRDDERRAFSGGYAQPHPGLQGEPVPGPATAPSNHPPIIQVSTQIPAITGLRKAIQPSSPAVAQSPQETVRATPGGEPTPGTSTKYSEETSNRSEMGIHSNDSQTRRDFSPSAALPPLQTRYPAGQQSASTDSPSSRFPPRKSSISQPIPPEVFQQPQTSQEVITAKPWAEARPSSPGAAARSPTTPAKGLPFIRPADIYRRMEEEREKERQSMDSNRPSMDSIAGANTVERPSSPSKPPSRIQSSSHSPGGGINRAVQESEDRVDSGQHLVPMLAPIQERKSEYGFDGYDTAQAMGAFEEKTDFVVSKDSQAGKLSPEEIRRFSTSPKLPDLNRISGFGLDLFSLPSTDDTSLQESVLKSIPESSRSTDQGEPSLSIHQPHSSTSVMQQALEAKNPSAPDTLASLNNSRFERTGTESTIGSNAKTNKVPSANSAERLDMEDGGRGNGAGVDEPNQSQNSTTFAADVPRDQSISLSNKDAEERGRHPGHSLNHSNTSTPSSGNSPVRPPKVTTANIIPSVGEGRISTTPDPSISPVEDDLPESSRPFADRELSFRPNLPGGWVSYATTATNSTTEQEPRDNLRIETYSRHTDSLDAPVSPISESEEDDGEVDLTPTTVKRLLPQSALGAAAGAAFNGATGSSSERRDREMLSNLSTNEINLQDSHVIPSNSALPTPDPALALIGNPYTASSLDPRLDDESSSGKPLLTAPKIPGYDTISTTSAEPPTPPPKDTPAEEPLHVNPEYFQPTAPLKHKTLEEVAATEDLVPMHPPPLLPTLSTQTSPQDEESDKLRKEIIKSLSPNMSDAETVQSLAPVGVRGNNLSEEYTGLGGRESTYLPSEYDNYWETTNEAEAEERERAEESGLKQEPEVHQLTQQRPIDVPDTNGSTPPPPPFNTQKTETASLELLPQRPPLSSNRFSWEAGPEEVSSTTAPSNPQLQVPVSGIDPRYAAAPDTQLRQLEQTKHGSTSASGYSPPTEGTLAGQAQEDASSTAASNSGEQRRSGGQESSHSHTIDGAVMAATVASGAAAFAAYQANQHGMPERRLSLAEEKNPVNASTYAVSPTPPEDEHPAHASQPTVPVSISGPRTIDQSEVTEPVSTLQPQQGLGAAKIMQFRDILALQNPEQRIRAYNDTRDQFSTMEIGLTDWLMVLSGGKRTSFPTGPETAANGADISNISKTVPSGVSGAPLQQPYYQHYLNASPTSSAPPMVRPGTGITSGSQQGFSPSGSKLSGQQVQTKSKDLLHSAGVFGGKASKAGKGLFAKGKNKLRGSGGGDKDSPPLEPSPAPKPKVNEGRISSWNLSLSSLALPRSSARASTPPQISREGTPPPQRLSQLGPRTPQHQVQSLSESPLVGAAAQTELSIWDAPVSAASTPSIQHSTPKASANNENLGSPYIENDEAVSKENGEEDNIGLPAPIGKHQPSWDPYNATPIVEEEGFLYEEQATKQPSTIPPAAHQLGAPRIPIDTKSKRSVSEDATLYDTSEQPEEGDDWVIISQENVPKLSELSFAAPVTLRSSTIHQSNIATQPGPGFPPTVVFQPPARDLPVTGNKAPGGHQHPVENQPPVGLTEGIQPLGTDQNLEASQSPPTTSQPQISSHGGFRGRLIKHIRQRSSKDGNIPVVDQISPPAAAPGIENSQPAGDNSLIEKRPTEFVGLPPIRRSSTFGLGFRTKDPSKRFTLDDDDEDEVQQQRELALPSEGGIQSQMQDSRSRATVTSQADTSGYDSRLSDGDTALVGNVIAAPLGGRDSPQSGVKPTQAPTETQQRPPLSNVSSEYSRPSSFSPVSPTVSSPVSPPEWRPAFTGGAPRDLLGASNGQLAGSQQIYTGQDRRQSEAEWRPNVKPSLEQRAPAPASYQRPPLVEARQSPSQIPSPATHPRHPSFEGQRPFNSASYSREPSFEGQRVRSPSLSSQGKAGTLPMLNSGVFVPPPRVGQNQQKSYDQPPSSAERYPALFKAEQGGKEASIDGLPAHYYQAPISKEDAFLPRQQTNEYQLPGVGPPPDRPQSGKRNSRRNSALFKELGGRLSRSASRDRDSIIDDDARSPIRPVESRDSQSRDYSTASITSEETVEKKKRKSGLSFLGALRRESTSGPLQSRESMVTHLPVSRTDSLLQPQPQRASSPLAPPDKRKLFFSSNRGSPEPEKFKSSKPLRASTSSLMGEQTGKKKRFSGITSIFSRPSMDQERRGSSGTAGQIIQDPRNHQRSIAPVQGPQYLEYPTQQLTPENRRFQEAGRPMGSGSQSPQTSPQDRQDQYPRGPPLSGNLGLSASEHVQTAQSSQGTQRLDSPATRGGQFAQPLPSPSLLNPTLQTSFIETRPVPDRHFSQQYSPNSQIPQNHQRQTVSVSYPGPLPQPVPTSQSPQRRQRQISDVTQPSQLSQPVAVPQNSPDRSPQTSTPNQSNNILLPIQNSQPPPGRPQQAPASVIQPGQPSQPVMNPRDPQNRVQETPAVVQRDPASLAGPKSQSPQSRTQQDSVGARPGLFSQHPTSLSPGQPTEARANYQQDPHAGGAGGNLDSAPVKAPQQPQSQRGPSDPHQAISRPMASPQAAPPNSQERQHVLTKQSLAPINQPKTENKQRQGSTARLFSGFISGRRSSPQQAKDSADAQIGATPQVAMRPGQPQQQQQWQQQQQQRIASNSQVQGLPGQNQQRGLPMRQEPIYAPLPIPGAYNLVRGEGGQLAPTPYDPRGLNAQPGAYSNQQFMHRDQAHSYLSRPPQIQVQPYPNDRYVAANHSDSPHIMAAAPQNIKRDVRPSLGPQQIYENSIKSTRPLSSEDLVARSPARPQFGQQAPYQLSLPDENADNNKGAQPLSTNSGPSSKSQPPLGGMPETDNRLPTGGSLPIERVLPRTGNIDTTQQRSNPLLRHPLSPATYPLPEHAPFSPINPEADQMPLPPPPKWPQQIAPSQNLDRSNTINTINTSVSEVSQLPGGQLSVPGLSGPKEQEHPESVTPPSPQITPERSPEQVPRHVASPSQEEDAYSASPRNSVAVAEATPSAAEAYQQSPDKILVDERGSQNGRRRASQEEKILVEEGMIRPGSMEEEIPSMSATSYPGQEWHPYGNGYEEWD